MWGIYQKPVASTCVSIVDTRYENAIDRSRIEQQIKDQLNMKLSTEIPQICVAEPTPETRKPRKPKTYLPCERLLKKISREHKRELSKKKIMAMFDNKPIEALSEPSHSLEECNRLSPS